MAKIEDRLMALELAVSELRAELDAARTRIRTMRQTLTCPSCGGRRILHFRYINESNALGLTPLSLTTQYSGWRGVLPGDPLEAFICKQCGLLEWHASGLENIEPDGEQVVELVHDEDAPPTPPYR